MPLYCFSARSHRAFLMIGNLIGLFVGAALVVVGHYLGEAFERDTPPINNVIYGFYLAAAFIMLTSIIGAIGSHYRLGKVIIIYVVCQAVLMTAEIIIMATAGSGYLIPAPVAQDLRDLCSRRHCSDVLQTLSVINSMFIISVLLFQIVLVWSAYNLLAFVKCFHAKNNYNLQRSLSKQVEHYEYYRKDVVVRPCFIRQIATPALWPVYRAKDDHSTPLCEMRLGMPRKHIQFNDDSKSTTNGRCSC